MYAQFEIFWSALSVIMLSAMTYYNRSVDDTSAQTLLPLSSESSLMVTLLETEGGHDSTGDYEDH